MNLPSSTAEATILTLRINGEQVQVRAGLRDTLLTVLRDQLQLTAAKRGCNQGVCGACTIEIDGRPARACLTLARACEGADVRTLEGMSDSPAMKALQDAFASHQAFQCGFCTPGMLVSARSLLEGNPAPDEAAIRVAMSGNLCRCTGYVSIIAAVDAAASTLGDHGASS